MAVVFPAPLRSSWRRHPCSLRQFNNLPHLLTKGIIYLIDDPCNQNMTERPYNSRLREDQAEATRSRILDALVEVLAEGVDALSIPAVAETAAVSVGTVYRHFGDKSGLLNALIPHAAASTGTKFDDIPDDLESLDEMVRMLFHHFDNIDDLLRAAFATGVGREVRVKQSAERLETMRQIFDSISDGLSNEQIEHLARIGLILTTSDVYMQWTDRLGMSPDEAADQTMWAFRAILEAVANE